MRWTVRNKLATLLVAGILVTYLGFPAGGFMPLIHDTLPMATTGFTGRR